MTKIPFFHTPFLFFRYLFFAPIIYCFYVTQSHFLSATPQVIHQNKGVIHISAAVSTKDVLSEIQALYTQSSPSKLIFNYGASGALVTQVLAGAPCEVVISADYQVLNRLQSAKRLDAEHIRPLLANRLVIALKTESPIQLSQPHDLLQLGIRKIALGKPDIVPAGTYAKLWLEKVELWEKLYRKFIFTPHVRAANTALLVGNVEAALVYKTDLLNQQKLRVGYEFPGNEAPKILYPLAVLDQGMARPEIQEFVEFLQSEGARAIFKKHGFEPVE